jgi:hypothetical protein
MNLPKSKPLAVIILVAVLTLLAQVPSINHWLSSLPDKDTHIVTLAEGIVGILLLIFATTKGDAK